MSVVGNDCDCQIVYGFREAQFRRLNDDGGCHTHGDWYATDCPVELGIDPEVEEGVESNLKCGDVIKNVIRTDDQLTGASVKFSMGCRNPEIEFIIAGSVGTITYDGSSPPCAIGYCLPTLAEQGNSYPFEAKFYIAEYNGSNVVAYHELHFYQLLPAFATYGDSQEEYGTQEWTIAAVENPSYDALGKPVFCWLEVAAIPT